MILFKPAAIDSKSPERPDRGRSDAQNAKYNFEIGKFRSREEEHHDKVRVQTSYRSSLDRQLQSSQEIQKEKEFYEIGNFQIGSDEQRVHDMKKKQAHDFFKKNGEDIRLRDIYKCDIYIYFSMLT